MEIFFEVLKSFYTNQMLNYLLYTFELATVRSLSIDVHVERKLGGLVKPGYQL